MKMERLARLLLGILIATAEQGCASSAGSRTVATEGLDRVTYYYCAGQEVAIAWAGGRAVEINLYGKRYPMLRVVAEDGARYESAADKVVLVVRGERETLTIGDRACGQYYPASRQPAGSGPHKRS
jgi:hypothetical protein